MSEGGARGPASKTGALWPLEDQVILEFPSLFIPALIRFAECLAIR